MGKETTKVVVGQRAVRNGTMQNNGEGVKMQGMIKRVQLALLKKNKHDTP